MKGRREALDEAYKLNFLYKKISLPYPIIRSWLAEPEFVERLLPMVNNSETIDDRIVLPIMQSILEEKERVLSLEGKRNTDGFNFHHGRRAVRILEQKLFSSDQGM